VVAYIFAKSLGRPYDAKAVARTAKEVLSFYTVWRVCVDVCVVCRVVRVCGSCVVTKRGCAQVQKAMDILNDVWLMNGKKYLMGEEVSIADLSCVCELMQVRHVRVACVCRACVVRVSCVCRACVVRVSCVCRADTA
jgi:hypothetical protein